MTIALTGTVLAWFARRTDGFRRIFRYLVMGLHLLFLTVAIASFSNERIVKEPVLEDAPMSQEDKKEHFNKCANSSDPLCGL